MDIQDLTPVRVMSAVRRAVRTGLDAEALAEFLASIDWSGFEQARPKVREILGQMEGWSTGYAEGELTRAEYVARLLSLLPAAGKRPRQPTLA